MLAICHSHRYTGLPCQLHMDWRYTHVGVPDSPVVCTADQTNETCCLFSEACAHIQYECADQDLLPQGDLVALEISQV